MKKIPWITVVLAALALVVTAAGFYEPAYFERKLISGGEWWRVLTAYLAHWSNFHLGINVFVFLCISGYAETVDRKKLAVALAVGATLVAAGFLWLMPWQAGYGGLSPLTFAALAWLAMRFMLDGEGAGALPTLAVAAVYIGGFAEVLAGYSVLAHAPKTPALEALPAAHLMGIVAGSLAAYHQRPGKTAPFSKAGGG